MTKPGMLLFFDSELDLDPSAAVVEVSTAVPVVVERAEVHQPVKSAYLARELSTWSPEDLRDYVAAEIIKRFGVFPRDPRKEHAIFTSFVQRWGIDRAVAIARHAYEVENGMWRGAPVRMQRFCKNSDPYFAVVIDRYLEQHT